MTNVFISYSSRDRDVADVVRAHLESEGLSAWIAPRDVPPGMSYPEAIIGAIRDCNVGLLILSNQANSSPHVLREVERISADGKVLFVLCIEQLELSDGLAYFASLLQWVDAPRDRLVRDPAKVLSKMVSSCRSGADPAPSATSNRLAGRNASLPSKDAPAELNFSALADAQRRMLMTFGVAVLDYVCQQPDPAKPIPQRELLSRLTQAVPGVFDGLSPRQFDSLLSDARASGCAPGLNESPEGLFVIEENIAVKRERNQVSKALIARHAAKFVSSGATVAVDGGSTTLPIVEELLASVEAGDLEQITILTNSLTSAQVISSFMSSQGWTDDNALIDLILVGGRVRPNTHATTWGDQVGREVAELLDEFARGDTPIDVGFIGGNGFALEPGITMGSADELGFKRFVLDHSAQPFIVADSSKAGITLPVQIADWSESLTLLTNVLSPDELITLDELVLSGTIVEVRE